MYFLGTITMYNLRHEKNYWVVLAIGIHRLTWREKHIYITHCQKLRIIGQLSVVQTTNSTPRNCSKI